MARKPPNGTGLIAVCCLVLLTAFSCGDEEEPVQASHPWLTTPNVPAAQAKPAPTSAPAVDVDPRVNEGQVRVAQVIDGDTFEIAGGEKVRVLGIDSCEMSTPRGASAKADAESVIFGTSVTLTSESGVDRDRYGRLLRYVKNLDGVDLGEHLVISNHTGVYQGRNDASAAYVAKLRGLDTDGRNCGEAPPPAPAEDHYVPTPNNEDDHHKSRYCRKHWWC